MRIDVLCGAPVRDGVDGVGRRPGDAQRGGRAEELRHLGEPAPKSLKEPSVASARPVATSVRLENDYVRTGLGQMPGRPHAQVAAADDDDVGRMLSAQLGPGGDRIGVGQPEPVGRALHYSMLARICPLASWW